MAYKPPVIKWNLRTVPKGSPLKFCSPILLCLAASGELLVLQILFKVAFETTSPFHVPATEWIVPKGRGLFVYGPSSLLFLPSAFRLLLTTFSSSIVFGCGYAALCLCGEPIPSHSAISAGSVRTTLFVRHEMSHVKG